MGFLATPQPSAPNAAGTQQTIAPHPEDALPQPFEKDISKLWTLYHRLARRLDDRGLIPEVSVIFPKGNASEVKLPSPAAPPPPPPPV
eukprot:4848837-Amphidinium_carterae.1